MVKRHISILAFLLLLQIACAPRQKSHFERGYVYGNMKMYEEAIVEYEKALEEDSLDHRVHFALGYIFSEMERWDKAIQHLEKSERLEPNYLNTTMLLAKAYWKTDRLYEGLSIFPTGTDTTDPQLVCSVGMLFYEEGYFEKALGYLERIADNREFFEMYPCLAQILCSEGRYEGAIEIMNSYLELDKNYYQFLRSFMLFVEIDSLDRSNELLQFAVGWADTYWSDKPRRPCHYRKGFAYYLSGDFESTVEEWVMAKAQYPKYPGSFHNLATAHLVLGECDNLSAVYKEVGGRFADKPFVELENGFSYLADGEYAKALEIFMTIREKWRESGVLHGYVAYTLEMMGKEEEAKRYWNLCILRVPGGTTEAKCKAFIHMMVNNAMTCFGNGQQKYDLHE